MLKKISWIVFVPFLIVASISFGSSWDSNNVIIRTLNNLTGKATNVTSYGNNLNVTLNCKSDVVANYYMYRLDQTLILTSGADVNDTVLATSDTTGVSAGDAITIYEDIGMFQSLVASTTANSVTMASGLDRAFSTDAEVEIGPWNMAVDGSVTPQIFKIKSPPESNYHLHSISGTILDNVADMTSNLFGGIAALTNGVVYRYKNDDIKQYAIIVNNTGFYEFGFDTYYDDALPTGQDALRFRVHIEELNGVVVKLMYSDRAELQLVVRDDLTDLTQYTTITNGHLFSYE